MSLLVRFLAFVCLIGIPCVASAQKAQKIGIRMDAPLRFNPPRFEVAPGTKLKIQLKNVDTTDQPHNFVLTYPGKREALVQAGMLLADRGPELEYVPEDESLVIAASSLVTPGVRKELEFVVPDEPGIYPYVCTFPGHGFVMYGAMYVGVTMPENAFDDPNVPKNALDQKDPITQRPYIQRMFVKDAGPAAIAVALPSDLNYVWDAGPCTLRYVWKGDFMDASNFFKSNGNALGKILGKPFYQVGPERLFGDPTAEVKFLGYSLDAEKIPTFRYRIGEREIRETLTETADGKLKRSFSAGAEAAGTQWGEIGDAETVGSPSDKTFSLLISE